MKKNIFIRISALLTPVFLFSACNFRQAALVEANIEGGIAADTAYIRYSPLGVSDTVAFDTVVLQEGRFSWNPAIEKPVEVLIELGRDRVSIKGRPLTAPEVYRIKFLAQPNEKIRLHAVYEENFLTYDLAGSSDLAMQSRLRNSVKEAYIKSEQLTELIRTEMANGAEYADEQYVDSLYDAYQAARTEIADACLDYVRRNTGKLHAAWLLLNHPQTDTFLLYYPRLKESVRQGILKENLEEWHEIAQRRHALRQNEERVSAGAEAPGFTLMGLDGEPVRLSDFADRYVVLDFWGTWCQWCVKGIPQMKAAYAKHKGKVVFLSIACRDREERVKAFVEKEKISWINVMNGEEALDVAFLYGVSGYPTKILLEPGLKVKNRYLGEVPEFYQDLDNLQ